MLYLISNFPTSHPNLWVKTTRSVFVSIPSNGMLIISPVPPESTFSYIILPVLSIIWIARSSNASMKWTLKIFPSIDYVLVLD